MKKLIAFVLTWVMVFSIAVTADTLDTYAAQPTEWDSERYSSEIDVNAKLKALHEENLPNKGEVEQQIQESFNAMELNNDSEAVVTENEEYFTFNGGTRRFWGLDDYNTQSVLGSYYWKDYTLRGIGENIEVWVANDLGYHAYNGPVKYGSELPVDSYGRPADIVTQEQVDMVISEFDDKIYDKDIEFFGTPDSHSGSESILNGYYSFENLLSDAKAQDPELEMKERVMIMVDNVRDDQYYDEAYPFYIAGFYSPTYELYMDRNMITLDSKWWHYKFPAECSETDPDHQAMHERNKFAIWGTIAHEFQHLIHDDNDYDEETWINDGMSDYAEYMCGYDSYWRHVNYFLDHPENSLVWWDEYYIKDVYDGEVLADYGQAFLMQLYLSDQFGDEFIKALARDEDNGITSVNKLLEQFETGIDFGELFRRFSIAVAIDSPQPGGGIYQFDSIDVKVNYESAQAFEKDGVPAWGGNYKIIENTDKIRSIMFDGTDFLGSPWKVEDDPLGADEKVLWGASGDEKSNKVLFKADLTSVSGPAHLTFDNYYEIEEQWDFGIVQVSSDNGNTWESLSNEHTRSDIVDQGYPAIKENLPGFTGMNGGWSNETFDISSYAGKEVLVCFNYMTDWGTTEAGWFIDNIEIPEINYANDCSSMESFISLDELNGKYVNYAVTFINERTVGKGRKAPVYKVVSVEPFNVTEEKALELKQLFKDGSNYMIVWFAAPEGVKDPVDFTYEIINKEGKGPKKK